MPRPKKGSDWLSVYSFEKAYATLEEPLKKALRKAHVAFRVVFNKGVEMYELVVRSVDYDRAFKVVRKTIDDFTRER